MNILISLCVFLPFACAVLAYAASKKSRSAGNLVTIISAAVVFGLAATAAIWGGAQTFEITALGMSFTMDGFRAIYACVISFMWLCAALISPQYFSHHRSARFYFFFFATLGATMGVFLSADLYTTFVFFEIMSLTSYAWVAEEETKDAMAAGKTYITIAVSGGLVTLMGLFMLYSEVGTLEISALHDAVAGADEAKLFWASLCLFFGFAAKAGIFPLHIWLPKAHPVAPAPASALLSGVLTKAGLFGVVIITAQIMRGNETWGNLLLWLGVVTMLLGAVLALLGTNLKYVLACSSLSQIGFITVGIAMLCLLGHENALASRGIVLYMMNHSLVKLVLFLSAGVIYANTHTLDLNKLKGFGRNKPLLAGIFLCGGLSLAGIPPFLGYSAKTLIHEAIVEYAAHGGAAITAVEWLFLISGGITLAYVLKLFIKIFIEKPDDEKKKTKYMTLPTVISLIVTPLILLAVGSVPGILGDAMGNMSLAFTAGAQAEHAVHYFSLTNLKGIIISAVIGLAIYFLIVRLVLTKKGEYKEVTLPVSLENGIYIPFFKGVLVVLTAVCRLVCDLPSLCILAFKKLFLRSEGMQKENRYAFLSWLGNKWDDLHPTRERLTAMKLISAYETVFDTTDRIISNLSFALIMACLGICLIIVVLAIV